MIAVNNQKDSVSPLPVFGKKKKIKSQTSKKIPSETKATPPKLIEGSEQSHSVSSSTGPYPQDPERNIQLASTGLPSILDEGTHKSQPLLEGMTKTTSRSEGTLGDKDSKGNKPPDDTKPINHTVVDPLGTGTEYQVDETQSTRMRYQILTDNNGKTYFKVDLNLKILQLTTLADNQVYLLYEDKLAQESDEEEVFAAGDDMEEDTHVDEEEHQASIEGYCEENVDHMEQTDKVIDAAMKSLDKNNIARGDILNALNGVTKTLKVIQEVVKEDPILNKKGLKSLVESLQATALNQEKHSANWAKSLTFMAWNLGPRITAVEISQAKIRTDVSSLRQDTSKIKSMMIEIYQDFKEKEDLIKKVVEQVRLLAITKPKVVKVVRKEAKMIEINPERITSAKEGTNRRNFEVYNPFAFSAFGRTKLDELREIIPKKKNIVVKDLMKSLSKRYERIKKVHDELGIQSTLPALVPEQAPSQVLGRKRKHIELEPKVKVHGLDCDRNLPEGVPFVKNIVIEELEYEIFFTDVFGDQAF
uniref:Uncharacterized protein n=1 Tax=Tanacetum cinerariifolium TaxID=118510 RepID=A0A6L2NGG9_TANCI|nr:hypothetical protein [Tanacetum cinerariifolium]